MIGCDSQAQTLWLVVIYRSETFWFPFILVQKKYTTNKIPKIILNKKETKKHTKAIFPVFPAAVRKKVLTIDCINKSYRL